MRCIFASDLHGHWERYRSLFKIVEQERPDAVLLGGDLLPNAFVSEKNAFRFLKDMLKGIRDASGSTDTRFFLILGNDDPRIFEEPLLKASKDGILEYVHFRAARLGDLWVVGYSYVPPSPFGLKDWEKYDVSRYVGPGCVDPSEGHMTAPAPENEAAQANISEDLSLLGKFSDPKRTIYLFHSPPADTDLDRVGLDGVMVDHVPLDVHVGSEAIKRFIQKRQPLVTLHGHIHESTAITGNWKANIGPTYCYNGAHDGRELSIIRFDPEKPGEATRELVVRPAVSS